ncbi:MAG: cytochrome c3 family protein [Raoultibacter sp.]
MNVKNKSKAAMLIAIASVCAILTCGLAACGQPHAPESATDGNSKTADSAMNEVAWSPEIDCLTCHETQAASIEDAGCPASLHADSACLDCHADEESLATVHKAKAGSDPSKLKTLKSTTIDEKVCVDCHGSWEELAAKTANVTVLTDSDGKTVNPHEVLTTSNTAGQHDDITCVDCHKMHSDESIDITAPRSCQTCHHMDVYECGTCHETA